MIKDELREMYPSGTRVSNNELKAVLNSLFLRCGIDAKATASDITKFGFHTRACKIPTDNGRINGLILTL